MWYQDISLLVCHILSLMAAMPVIMKWTMYVNGQAQQETFFEIARSDHTILMTFFAESVWVCFLIFKNPKIFKIGPKMSDWHYITYVKKYLLTE